MYNIIVQLCVHSIERFIIITCNFINCDNAHLLPAIFAVFKTMCSNVFLSTYYA